MKELNELREAVQKGRTRLVKQLVPEALQAGIPPQDILNQGLLAAMDVVGTRFRANEIFVPEVLVAARAMNAGAALLKPLLVKSVRWSEELSIAMESRGFDGRVPRTCSQPLRLRPVDVLFPILSCALFLALFFLLGR